MDRFWFPPLPLHSFLGCLTSVSFLIALSPQAIAQVLNPQDLSRSQSFDEEDEKKYRFAYHLDLQSRLNSEQANRGMDSHVSGTFSRILFEPTSESRVEEENLNQETLGEERLNLEPLREESPNPEPLGEERRNTRFRNEAPVVVAPSIFGQESNPVTLEAWRQNRSGPNGSETNRLGTAQLIPSTDARELAQVDTLSELEVGDDGGSGQEDESIAQNPAMPNLENLDLENLDPELGLLRLHPLSNDISGTDSSAAVLDPELGVLRLRAIPQTVEAPATRKRSIVFAQGHLGFFSGNNLLARTEPLPDTTLQTGLTFRAVPRLGRRTFLVGTAGGSLLNYADHGEFDYRQLDLSLGVYHWLNRRTYVDVGWRNQQFFAEDGGDRFLNDHQARLSVGRADQLTPNLSLDSTYHLQASWSDPTERSRLTNRFSLGLSHPISSTVDASVSYQLALIDFTQQDRYDSYHQFLAQLQFGFSEEGTITVFGGGRLGDSTHSLIDFDSTLFGLSLVMNVSLF